MWSTKSVSPVTPCQTNWIILTICPSYNTYFEKQFKYTLMNRFTKGTHIMKKYRFRLLMFSALIAFAFSCARPDSALEITFSHILSDQSEWHTGAEAWKQRV